MDQTYYGHTYINQFFFYQFLYLRGGPFIGKCICEFVGFLIFFIPFYWLGLKISWLKDFFFSEFFFLHTDVLFRFRFSIFRFLCRLIYDSYQFCLQCFHHLSVLAKECWCTATCCVYFVFPVTLSRYLQFKIYQSLHQSSFFPASSVRGDLIWFSIIQVNRISRSR